MKKLVTIGAIALAIAVLAYSQRANIASRLMAKGLESRMGADAVAELEDGLHLALCGAGGPLPAPNASGPCVAVVAGKQLFMVDAGTDGPRNLGRMGCQPGSVKGVFLTHFHSDHIDGLREISTIRWAGGDNDAPYLSMARAG
ncbi:MBL fold metallo-hydrolase [Porticoccus sp.]|uniref:MBL fold metallo-hydrolase n=1 Tax=Porticoccus sp. TaxID=2024853 RepID=UPI003F6A4B45